MKGTQMASKAQKEQDDRAANKAMVKDLQTQLDAAKKAQLDKLEKSKAHLIAQLDMAAEKYLTVNGYMQARSTIDQAAFGRDVDDPDTLARQIAREMSELACLISTKIDKVDVFNLGENLIDGYLQRDFVGLASPGISDVVYQLLVANLLQNVGPVLDDILSFRESTSEQIKIVEDEIAKLDKPAKLKAVK